MKKFFTILIIFLVAGLMITCDLGGDWATGGQSGGSTSGEGEDLFSLADVPTVVDNTTDLIKTDAATTTVTKSAKGLVIKATAINGTITIDLGADPGLGLTDATKTYIAKVEATLEADFIGVTDGLEFKAGTKGISGKEKVSGSVEFKGGTSNITLKSTAVGTITVTELTISEK